MTPNVQEVVGPLWGLSEFCLCLLKRSKAGATSKDRHSLMIIWLVYLLTIPSAVVAAYRLRECELTWTRLILSLAAGLFVVGVGLRWYCIFYLGRFFTVNVAIAADHHLVESGPYRLVRHPSYTGGLLAALGFGLSLQNWAALLIFIVPCCGVTWWRIQVEEKALLEGLGGTYREYIRRTKRLIPFVY